ncbi:MAG: diphthamide biosynthesis enzyme Dph2 [Thermoplasmata archaeon]
MSSVTPEGAAIELEPALRAIRDRGSKTVGIQYPDGLRLRALEVADRLEAKAKVTVMVSAQPTYGACDVPQMPVDLILQIGHAPMPYLNLKKVVFVEAPMAFPSLDFLEGALPRLGRRVGLLTNVQHQPWLPEVAAYLSTRGKVVEIGGADGRTAYAGQLLGCDVHPARELEGRVDTFLYVGTGDFHPLGVALATATPVIVADPFTEDVRDLTELKEHVLRVRHAAIALAREGETFGIIVSRKVGQYRMALARKIKELLASAGRKGYLLLMDTVSPELLQGYRVDAFVNTACPRIAIDDSARYEKPVLTFPELEVALDLRAWDPYPLDEITAHQTLGES